MARLSYIVAVLFIPLLLLPIYFAWSTIAVAEPVQDEADSPQGQNAPHTADANKPEKPPEAARTEFKEAGVCARCHVLSVLEWSVSTHVGEGIDCRICHGTSQEHVANERNEIKPDRIPHGEEIAKLCVDCHDDGCPETLEMASCQECHHVHALLHPEKTPPSQDDRTKELSAYWEEVRRKMEEGERLIRLQEWEAAQAVFEDVLVLSSDHRRARMRLEFCRRRLDPNLPGFQIVGDEFDPRSGLPREVNVENLGIEMVLVPPGEFDMGSDQLRDARPVHTVRVEPFYLGKYEVTQGQWESWMGSNPSIHQGQAFPDADRMPVEGVSWDDCKRLLGKLNELVPGGGFRLPTEAEWEYACRAGTGAPGDPESFERFAWYRNNSAHRSDDQATFKQVDAYAPHPVGTMQPNPWGLYDMQGNVWEWCSSLWRPYLFDPADGRESPSTAGLRVLRGGGFADTEGSLHPAMRHGERPHRQYRWNGLRLARSVPVK